MKGLFGVMGIGLIEGVQQLPQTTPTSEIIKIAVQLIIGIATLLQIIKKPKTTIENVNTQKKN